MRNPGILLICLIVALTCVSARAEQTYVYEALLFSKPVSITIDGDLSDWEGLGAKEVSLDNICQQGGRRKLSLPRDEADLSAHFRCVADPENFYVAVAVTDDRLVFGEPVFGAAYNDDSVEIYFDGGLERHGYSEESHTVTSTDYDANDAEIRFSLESSGGVRLEGMGLFGDRLMMLPGLWESMGITAAIEKNPSGYTAELKVPKLVFVSVPLRSGVQIGFNVMINDDDNGGPRDSKISWSADLFDQSWITTKYFGRLLLAERK
jgi:hypothetical protein